MACVASAQHFTRTVTFDVDANMSGSGSGGNTSPTASPTTGTSTMGSTGVPANFGVTNTPIN